MKKKKMIAFAMAAVLFAGGFSQLPWMPVQAKEAEIQTDIPDLKDAVTENFGDDFLVGTAVTGGEINEKDVMALVTKHFNAVTFGNELKPDCMFGYSNNQCPGTEEITLNGKKMIVPVTDFSRAEKWLDYFYDWNQANPEDQIKIRGHVLTWHSQTPEWFFHKDYDASKEYVSPEEMTQRHEWYIKTVLEHFVGEESKYKDMFYGWDVVNEAVSDSSGSYRTDQENSSWWAVYGNQDFIINAFRFANQYAPESLELYYNDYNDSDPKKCKGIVALLTDVKNAEGTRITGMGMQGHYQTADSTPTIDQFKEAARAYAAVVDKVQLTEMDFQASSAYDGTEATYPEEDMNLAYRYKDFYDAVKELREEGIQFSGITVWGVVDRNSWLQTASFVGGGADGKRHQMPLFFDDDCQAKSAYWAWVDPSKLTYPIKKMELVEAVASADLEEVFAAANTYSFEKGDVQVEFSPVWSQDNIQVQIAVKDDTEDVSDAVTVYYEGAAGIQTYTVKRAEATSTKKGYETVVTIDTSDDQLSVARAIRMDVACTNGTQSEAFNDHALNQENSTEYYASGVCKPFTMIPKGTVSIDGELDEIWKTTPQKRLSIEQGTSAQAAARILWDDEYLYVYVTVKDSALHADNQEAEKQDCVAIMIDEKNQKSANYQDDDKLYRINYQNVATFHGKKCSEDTLQSATRETEDGYVVEAAFAWTTLKAYYNKEIGLEIQVNDVDADGTLLGTCNWSDASGAAGENTSVFGTVKLGHEGEALEEDNVFDEKNLSGDTEVGTADSDQTVKQNIFQRFWSWLTGLF